MIWLILGGVALFFLNQRKPGPELPPSLSRADILAPQVAQDIADNGMQYDRDLLRAFQSAAGIQVDGDYGPQSHGALQKHWVPDPPPALYPAAPTSPRATLGVPLVFRVAADIRDNGDGYDRQLLRQFQAEAGIRVDGLYGPESARALSAAGLASVPPPLYGGA
jgi:hypothetical protein